MTVSQKAELRRFLCFGFLLVMKTKRRPGAFGKQRTYYGPNRISSVADWRGRCGQLLNLWLQECRKCKGILEKNTMAVVSPKLGNDAAFHPGIECFLLVDMFCGRA